MAKDHPVDTKLGEIEDWLVELMRTNAHPRHLHYLDCIVLRVNQANQQAKPTWEDGGRTMYARINSGVDEKFFEHVHEELQHFPQKVPDLGKPWVDKWLGVYEIVIHQDGSEWMVRGPIIDMTNPPANLLELTKIYVAYRDNWLRNLPKPRYRGQNIYLWAEAFNDYNTKAQLAGNPPLDVSPEDLFIPVDAQAQKLKEQDQYEEYEVQECGF